MKSISDDKVFRTLADSLRRFLLDLLFERERRPLTEIENKADTSRTVVMKHTQTIEDGGLTEADQSGRSKLRSLNHMPIRVIHDRRIAIFCENTSSVLVDLKNRFENRSRLPLRPSRHDGYLPDPYQGQP